MWNQNLSCCKAVCAAFGLQSLHLEALGRQQRHCAACECILCLGDGLCSQHPGQLHAPAESVPCSMRELWIPSQLCPNFHGEKTWMCRQARRCGASASKAVPSLLYLCCEVPEDVSSLSANVIGWAKRAELLPWEDGQTGRL